MICRAINKSAIREMPIGFHVRNCRRSELDTWKAIHFDDAITAQKYYEFMTNYFDKVYSYKADLFFKECLFVCDKNDHPIGTCFIWKAYNKINTLHWFKVVKEYEGLGIGRALLSIVLQNLGEEDFPIYLHTQPSSYRAIKLYSDFGFCLLTDPIIGNRYNDLKESLLILEKHMPHKDYTKLQMTTAPKEFLEIVGSSKINQF